MSSTGHARPGRTWMWTLVCRRPKSGSAATSALSSSPQKVRKTSANSHQLLTVQTGTISCVLNTNSQPFIGKYVTLSQQRAIIVL